MSNFAFLQAEFAGVHEAARQAEACQRRPRAACFYARRALELALAWLYRSDPALRVPYRDDLAARIHEPSFQQAAGSAIVTKAQLIKGLGNRAVHDARAVVPRDAVAAVRAFRPVDGTAEIEAACNESTGLARFVRLLIGLDRVAAKALFDGLLSSSTATANQIEFLDLLIDHLTEQGIVPPERLYESPFTDLSPAGPEALFSQPEITSPVEALREASARAA